MALMLPLAMIGIQEIWPIALILVLLFGARKLPELARSMGSSITQFKKGLKEAPPEIPSDDGDGDGSDESPGGSGGN